MKLLMVEIEYNNERRIWTKETWPNREELKKCFDQDFEFNQRFTRVDMDDQGGWTRTSTNKYKKINITKNKEDEATQKPPASPSVHLSFKNKNTEQKAAPPQQKSASPPRPKEKPPSNESSRTLNSVSKVSNELTEQERKTLREILGSELEKYETKRQDHLKKCPKSYHHKKRAIDTIKEWYFADKKEKLVREKALKEGKSQVAIKRGEKGRKLVNDLVELNPKHGKFIEPYNEGVEIGEYSPGGGRQIATYDDPELYRKIEDMLMKVKRYEGLDYKMPLTEKEYLE